MPLDQSMTSQWMTSRWICVVRVTGLSQNFPKIHLSWETSMVKKLPMIFNVVNVQGHVFDNEGKRANQVSSFDTNMTPQKSCFLKRFFLSVERKIDADMADFTLRCKYWEILKQHFEMVCWARFRSDISQKYVLFLACNRTVGCS